MRRSILGGLADNPALPADLISELIRFRRVPRVANRPDLTPALVEEIIATDDSTRILALARHGRLPGPDRLRLAAHGNPWLRRAAIRNWAAPREVFARLAADPDVDVRADVARNEHAPDDVRAGLLADPEPHVRAELGGYWPAAPVAVRRALLTDPVDTVRRAACAAPPPEDLLPALLADRVTRQFVVRYALLDHDLAVELATDEDDEVRLAVADHPALPPAALDLLATDRRSWIQVRIFARPDTPEPTRAAIHAAVMADPDLLERYPRNRYVDPEVEERDTDLFMAQLELRGLRLTWVTANPLPYADSPYPSFRASAAAGAGLPEDAVRRLLDDPDHRVRLTMLRNAPDPVDPATAERFEREYQPDKLFGGWRPADTVTFPPETLRRFATDPDATMRRLASRDPDLPPELAARLAVDPDASVRRAIAEHPKLPIHALLGLLADDQTAFAAARSPILPVDRMRQLIEEARAGA